MQIIKRIGATIALLTVIVVANVEVDDNECKKLYTKVSNFQDRFIDKINNKKYSKEKYKFKMMKRIYNKYCLYRFNVHGIIYTKLCERTHGNQKKENPTNRSA